MTTHQRGLTEPAAETAIDQACRLLRLPTIRGQFIPTADAAEREQLTYRGFLAELLMAECDDRQRRRSERRIKGGGEPWPPQDGATVARLWLSLDWCGRPGGQFDLRTVGCTGFLVDLLLVFGAQPGPAVEALAQDIGVPGMPGGLAEDMDHDGEQVRVPGRR